MLSRMLVNNCVDFDILAQVYRPKDKIPVATVKKLIKQEDFMAAVSDKVIELLDKAGGTKEYLLEFRLKAANGALDDGKWKDAGELIKPLEDMQEMTPKQVRTVTTDQISVVRKENNMLESVTAKRQIEGSEAEEDSKIE